MIEAGGVAEADRVGGGEQAEIRVRTDHLGLVQQGQRARGFQHALDHEHHVRTTGVIFIEQERDRALQGPGQDAFLEFGDLLAVLQHDGVLADHVDTADMAVQIDPDHRPVEARGDLLDMRGLAGAVIALDHHPAIIGKAGQDGARRGRIEHIVRIHDRRVLVRGGEHGDIKAGVEAEQLLAIGYGIRGGKGKTVAHQTRLFGWARCR